MSKKATPTVQLDALTDALLFIDDLSSDAEAWVCRETGAVHIRPGLLAADMLGPDAKDLPEDLDSSDRYLSLPNSRDLDLGRPLVFRFVEEVLPEDERLVHDMFHKKGAYRRWRELLERRNVLQRWYDFQRDATEAALRAWCEENGLRLASSNRPA